MERPRVPPHDGSLTVVPGFLDFQARYNPELPWARYPSLDDPERVEEITFTQLSEATHRIAHTFRPRRLGNDGEVVALLIHCDTILYVPTICGLMRADLVPFPISPRNSPEAVVNLMEKTESHRLVISQSLGTIGDAVSELLLAKDHDVRIQPMPSLHDIYPHLASPGPILKSDFTPYPTHGKPCDPDEVAMILHSSGSTGMPKPIPKTQRIMLQWASCEMGILWAGMALPTLHTMGLFIQLYSPLSGGLPIGLYTPREPQPPVVPNPENILKTARVTGCSGIISVPSIVELWAQDQTTIQYLSSLKLLSFGGGPLSTTSGNRLVENGVRLQSMYGLTECGGPNKGYRYDETLPSHASLWDKWDWEWIEIAETMRPRWVPQGDGTYELQFLTCETHQPSVENLSDAKGFGTLDLFLPHPTKKGLWKLVGRQDDVIVLSSGEKIVPIAQENHIISNTFAAGAVMFGRGQPQPGILVEPSAAYACNTRSEAEVIKYRDLIWPFIEEANRLGPAFARLFKETVIVVDASKALPRVAKGNVMRKQAWATYHDEISQLYKTLEESSILSGILLPNSWDAETLKTWLSEHVQSLNNGRKPSPDADLFAAGLDSLSATILRSCVVSALRSSKETKMRTSTANISQNFIFEHPTIGRLAKAISGLIDPTFSTVVLDESILDIPNLIDKYTAGLSIRVSPIQLSPHNALTVLVTGSTGNLGSHIVAALLSDQRIAKVYTFDRPASGLSPHEGLRSAFEDRGLPTAILSDPRLVNLTGDLNLPSFGLDPAKYNVNFNHPLASFETQIAGTRKLIDFCLESKYSPKLFFTSSISVAQGADPVDGPIPEAPISNPCLTASSGYASSKYVVETLIEHAVKSGLRGTSLRIGQICGSSGTGAWNTTDWVPILVKSSVSLGCLPDIEWTLDWTPIDAVASAILDLMMCPDEPASSVVNVVHPRPVPWSTIFGEVKNVLRSPMTLVPYGTWLAKLEEVNQIPTPAVLESMPALQLLNFFRNIGGRKGINSRFSTNELCRLSSTMRSLEPLGHSHVHLWIDYWRRRGFIPMG